ncbi:tetratricopeptide repeat protein [Flavobacterium sp. MC2016-06]|uniref:tetratricopeptide repeat protein n=1 Tax=Flavobacterium sp. MC2016-06 TaxID=2676308 RepID=UPI0018AD0DBF|nr:tetratricopeptide repeat protein [Flavobacterium sp. MC2016-06]MBU3860438.1 hypothetical protein [Flavobacterium sp. MC2016-06]
MNVTDYTYLINKPDAITEKQTDALGSVLNEFPYFQSARALRLKGLYNQSSFKYNYALKVTAAHTADRSVLFDFITSESFTSIQEKFYDQKLKELLQMNVIYSEVISPTDIQKNSDIRIDPIEKSILDSIKEATNVVFERPIKIEEEKIEPVIEQPVLDAVKKIETVTFEEPENREETKVIPIIDQSILDAIKKVEAVTFEEQLTVKVEEPKIENHIDPAILDAIKKVETVTFEEPANIEETQADPIIEQSVVDAVTKIESVTFEEAVKVEESIIEEPEIEEHVLTAIKEIEAAIPAVRIDPIEEAMVTAMEEASTVIFEEVKTEVEQKEEQKEQEEEEQEEEEKEVVEVAEPVKTAIEHLEIGKPLDFSNNEKHSFQEWLQLARTEPIDRSNETVKEGPKEEDTVENELAADEERKKKAEIIDKFIETNPKIPPIKPTAINSTVLLDLNKDEDNSYLMTETLARVYLEQKKYTKAIQAYEILILKYPEKISFFADRISDIKILQQNNNNN